MTKPKDDPINPQHYKVKGGLEAIDMAEMLGLDKDAWLFNTFKYIVRASKKRRASKITDLKKAIWYIERRIKCLEQEEK